MSVDDSCDANSFNPGTVNNKQQQPPIEILLRHPFPPKVIEPEPRDMTEETLAHSVHIEYCVS